MALIDKITEQSKSAGASVEVPVGEGIQNVPVGTMLAHIETATKLMAATHKLGHLAQDEELQLIADLFRENPSSFWKGNKQAKNFWDEQKFIQALDTYTLKPRSDPNIPSHIHRVMRAVALTELQAGPLGALMDPMETLKRVLFAMREDPKGLIKPPPAPSGQPSPEEITANAKMLTAQNQGKSIEVKAAEVAQKGKLEAAEQQASKEDKTIDLAKALVTHAHDKKNDANQHGLAVAKHNLDVGKAAHEAAIATHGAVLDTAEAMKPEPISDTTSK